MHELSPAFPTFGILPARLRASVMAVVLALCCASPVTSLETVAAPGQADAGVVRTLDQNVDYIGPEAGAALDLGFPVLVPSGVPAPFGGSPAIDSGGGYYGLYWMNAGGEPTFLQVTGQVGGSLPAGSPYDLNVQLFINSQVQGYGAIHDVTPAYDTVWWIAEGVLYKVESRNSSTDSLTLANSLIRFVPPTASEPEPEPEPTQPEPEPEPEPTQPQPEPEPEPTTPPRVEEPALAPVTPEPQPETNVGGSTTLPPNGDAPDEVDVSAPDVDEPQVEAPGGGSADSATASESDPGEEPNQEPTASVSDERTTGETDTPEVTQIPPAPPLPSDGTGETTYSSDGTGGAQNLVVGSDGTGGTIDVVIPLAPAGQATP